MRLRKTFVMSATLLLLGFFTIPLVGGLAGASITPQQGAAMGGVLFVGRWLWLWFIDWLFDRLLLREAGPTQWPWAPGESSTLPPLRDKDRTRLVRHVREMQGNHPEATS